MSDWYFSLSALSGRSLGVAAAVFAGFVAVLWAASVVLPGHTVQGPLLDGERRSYKINGLAMFLLAMIAAGLLALFYRSPMSGLHSHFTALFVVANVFAFGLSGWLYFRGTRSGARSGDVPGGFWGPGGFWRGFFFGVDLNPRCAGVDLKLFSYRPSLIGLAMFNVSFAVVQYQTYGRLTLGMTLYQVLAFVYVLNYFQFEQGMVNTWDMVSERFGWMLVWGDYVLVPFFYCIVGWSLIHEPEPLSPLSAAGVCALFVLGFWMFRGANDQKHRFKGDPDSTIWGRPAEALDGRLLVSGFWGLGRHLNYTGEICVYLAFALTAGGRSWIPFLLPAWLGGLLVHRCRRDERRCRAKYGDLWTRYTERVRFAMVPYLY